MTMARKPDRWCAAFGLRLLGEPPRGWRDAYAPRWDAPIPITEFYQRACRSMLAEDFSPHGWLALMDAAQRVEDEHRRAGTHWLVQFDRDFGALYADGEQIRLPGPVVRFTIPPPERDAYVLYPRLSSNPYMIEPRPRPELFIGIRIAPRPPDTYTLADATQWLDRAGEAPLAMTCPTCGTVRDPGETRTPRTDESAAH